MPITKEYITLNIEDIIPYENNPRINDDAVAGVVESIKQCGELDPIEVDENNVILSGHTRLKAYNQLGYDSISVLRITGLTEPQKRKYRLLTNKTGEVAAWDFDKLCLELEGLDFDGFDFGFDVDLPSLEEDAPKEVVEDDYDEEPPAEPKAKLGDIYQLGQHRLICGDSTDPAVIDRLMDGVKADMVFTDPPYGMNLDTDFSGMQNHLDFAKEKGFTGGKKYEQGKVDEFHPEMIDAVFTIDADEMFLWGADYFAELLPNKNDGSWIVWDKRANGNDDVAEDYSSDKMYGSCFELCWSKKKHKRDIARVKWAGVFGTEQEFDHKRYHPTQKPIKLAGWFLDRYSKEGQTVVDLFGGSGSTLIACEQLNRKCYMCELDPKYVSVIVNRWLNLTGRKDEIFCIRDGQKLTYDEVFN